MSSMTLPEMSSIGVVGAGVAGITAAYALSKKHSVTLYEKQERLGGHTNTITVSDPEAGDIGVDTGFIVMNDRTYPTLHTFLEHLSVPVRYADMSFSVQCEQSGLTYGSRSLAAVLCTPKNFLKPAYYRLLIDFPRFWRQASRWLEVNPDSAMTVRDFVKHYRYSRSFLHNFLLPMGAAIWSSPDMRVEDFPVRFFLNFFKNHGMLSYADQPRWQTVLGGSHQYLHAFSQAFTGTIRTGVAIRSIARSATGGVITLASGEELRHDHIILATHADEALSLLSDADALETELLSTWVYQPNEAVLHTDTSFLPDVHSARASWNYRRGAGDPNDRPVSITYDLTRLQGLPTSTRYLVTLNPHRSIKPDSVIYKTVYTHPQYTLATERAQQRLPELRNRQGRSFAGSYFRFGFHEDACSSGQAVAAELGVPL